MSSFSSIGIASLLEFSKLNAEVVDKIKMKTTTNFKIIISVIRIFPVQQPITVWFFSTTDYCFTSNVCQVISCMSTVISHEELEYTNAN